MNLSNPIRLNIIAILNIVVAISVFSFKWIAYKLTGSVALYSDALESIVNVVAASAAYLAIWFSSIPADKNYPYGHTKAEYLSAVLEGVFILAASLTILYFSIQNLIKPTAIQFNLIAFFVNLLASIVNYFWAVHLLKIGKLNRSPALLADAKHIMADIVTSVGVLLGVVAAKITGLFVLDSLLAILVALNILWSGYKLMSDSVGGLMDKSADEYTEKSIRSIMSKEAVGALEMHDLRTRVAASKIFIEFHLIVPSEMTVGEAHMICDRLEDALNKEIAGSIVTIHVEPSDHAKQTGVIVL